MAHRKVWQRIEAAQTVNIASMWSAQIEVETYLDRFVTRPVTMAPGADSVMKTDPLLGFSRFWELKA